MKKTVTVWIATALLTSCQPQGYTIEGTLTGENVTGKAYLEYPSYMDGLIRIDSTTIQNGKFVFKGKVDRPEQYHLLMKITSTQTSSELPHGIFQSSLYIDNSDMTYAADLTHAVPTKNSSLQIIADPTISGSPTHNFYLRLNKEITILTDNLKRLNKQEQEARKEQILELLKTNSSSIVAVNLAISLLTDKSLSFSARQIELLVGTFKKSWANTAEMVALEFTAALAYPSKDIPQ